MKDKLIGKVSALLLPLSGLFYYCTSADKIDTLTPAQYQQALKRDSSAVILDVRRPEEYRSGHLPEAVSLDYLDSDVFRKTLKTLDKKNTYYIYCRSGKRSHAAAILMKRQGLRVRDLKGGIIAWTECGFAIQPDSRP